MALCASHGRITTLSTLSREVYIFDIKNYTWVSGLNTGQGANTTSKEPQTNQTYITPNSTANNGIFIGIGIGAGAIVLIGILSFVGFLLYKKRRKSLSYIPTPGNYKIQRKSLTVIPTPGSFPNED
ncbi:14843_t:CDS:2 [Dentiscutata heterogama]|uniref:14843_t:CDS:1 n=1 Tax=Dentiscutata heterogama TaxID=1316150 RepID=A0ACA9K3Q7_9GLOM|nr:14843_t:CDS:2 [Dentiscutata heterogama]